MDITRTISNFIHLPVKGYLPYHERPLNPNIFIHVYRLLCVCLSEVDSRQVFELVSQSYPSHHSQVMFKSMVLLRISSATILSYPRIEAMIKAVSPYSF